MSLMLTLAIGAGVLAVLYGVLQTLSLMRSSPGSARMQEIAAAIAGPGQIRSVSVTSQAPRSRLSAPRA